MGDDSASREHSRLLQIRGVHKSGDFFTKAKVFNVPNDANDLARSLFIHGIRIVTQAQLLSNRIFVREVTARKSFVDHNHPRSTLCIVLIGVASFPEWNSQGAEKAGT